MTSTERPGLQHVLLTRFNLPIGAGDTHLDPDWLEGRFTLFSRYCLPSVKGQLDQDFQWLILLYQGTPETYLDRLRALLPANARLAMMTKPLDDQPLGEVLRVNGFCDSESLLSSRLDSDDCIGVRYTALMRRAALKRRGSQRIAFNLPLGLQWKNGRCYGWLDRDNAFMSMLEPPGAWRTVLSSSHRDIANIAAIRQIAAGPQWLQVMHGGNLDNRVQGVRVARRWSRTSFPHLVEDEHGTEDRAEVAADVLRSIARVAAATARRVTDRARRNV